MIFATVGTQIPFDRFVRILDELAAETDEEIIAQTSHGQYEPRNIRTFDFLEPDRFDEVFDGARLIVAHAGMGTIISAMQRNKPIIVMPRVAAWGEHRNEHQLATAAKLAELQYVYVAHDKDELRRLMFDPEITCRRQVGDVASDELVNSLKDFIG